MSQWKKYDKVLNEYVVRGYSKMASSLGNFCMGAIAGISASRWKQKYSHSKWFCDRGVARNLLRGDKRGDLGTGDGSPHQGPGAEPR